MSSVAALWHTTNRRCRLSGSDDRSPEVVHTLMLPALLSCAAWLAAPEPERQLVNGPALPTASPR